MLGFGMSISFTRGFRGPIRGTKATTSEGRRARWRRERMICVLKLLLAPETVNCFSSKERAQLRP